MEAFVLAPSLFSITYSICNSNDSNTWLYVLLKCNQWHIKALYIKWHNKAIWELQKLFTSNTTSCPITCLKMQDFLKNDHRIILFPHGYFPPAPFNAICWIHLLQWLILLPHYLRKDGKLSTFNLLRTIQPKSGF